MSVQYECPICLEIPSNEIYQCPEGHIICDACYKKVKYCPQCRFPFDFKIRCRAREEVLDSMDFPCSSKNHGCEELLKRDKLAAHSKKCDFRPDANCSSCDKLLIPGKVRRFMCLQCRNYNLCRTCIDRNLHPGHLFALLETIPQTKHLHEFAKSMKIGGYEAALPVGIVGRHSCIDIFQLNINIYFILDKLINFIGLNEQFVKEHPDQLSDFVTSRVTGLRRIFREGATITNDENEKRKFLQIDKCLGKSCQDLIVIWERLVAEYTEGGRKSLEKCASKLFRCVNRINKYISKNIFVNTEELPIAGKCVGLGCQENIGIYYVCLLCPGVSLCEECVNKKIHPRHVFGLVRHQVVEEFVKFQNTVKSSIIPSIEEDQYLL